VRRINGVPKSQEKRRDGAEELNDYYSHSDYEIDKSHNSHAGYSTRNYLLLGTGHLNPIHRSHLFPF